MIIVNIAMKQEEIKALLAENGFTFVKKQGLQLFFEAPSSDLTAEAANAKNIIKSSEFGQALFFNVGVEA